MVIRYMMTRMREQEYKGGRVCIRWPLIFYGESNDQMTRKMQPWKLRDRASEARRPAHALLQVPSREPRQLERQLAGRARGGSLICTGRAHKREFRFRSQA